MQLNVVAHTTTAGAGPVIPGTGTMTTNTFTPTTGQTVFTLSATPTDALSVEVDVNGQSFSPGSGAFTLAGAAVTWTGAYALDANDTVVITFF